MRQNLIHRFHGSRTDFKDVKRIFYLDDSFEGEFIGVSQVKHVAIIGGWTGRVARGGGRAQSAKVTLFDAKPSVGRKFLVAGKGGLNITKAEDFEDFAEQYRGPDFPVPLWTRILARV